MLLKGTPWLSIAFAGLLCALPALAEGEKETATPGLPAAAPEQKEPSAVEKSEQAKVDALIEDAQKEPESPAVAPPAQKSVKKTPAKKKAAAAKKSVAKVTVKKTDPKTATVAVAKAQPKPPPAPVKITKPLSAFELGRYQYCGDDRDCMVAVNGCCDCANGGEDVAVNRERFEAFRARFDCLHVSCSEKAATPECASGVVSCLNHKCRYISDQALDDKF